MNRLLELIGESTGCELITENLPMQPGDVDKTFANIDKAKQLLDYAPETSVREGLKKYVEWYNNNTRL